MNNDESKAGRWWEFYAVRYFPGSVVGGVIFLFLCQKVDALKPMLFGVTEGNLDGPRLMLLFGFGLSFCYISSAPILVFHAGRFFDQERIKAGKNALKHLVCLILPTVLTIAFGFVSDLTGGNKLIALVALWLGAFVFFSQMYYISGVLLNINDTFKIYRKLADKREKAKGEVVDSYRHLREHGNAFYIIILEVVLALVLYSVAQVSISLKNDSFVGFGVIVFILWTFPASLVWVVGTLLEREFIDS